MPVFRYNFEKILTKRLRESSNVAFAPKNDPSLPFWPYKEFGHDNNHENDKDNEWSTDCKLIKNELHHWLPS